MSSQPMLLVYSSLETETFKAITVSRLYFLPNTTTIEKTL